MLSDFEKSEICRLAKTEPFFTTIAEKLGLKIKNVRHFARREKVRLVNPGHMGLWNRKHWHLREAVLTYFLNHSFEETARHFSLKKSELKSLFTLGYRMPEWAHLRKDTRRRDTWSEKETLFALRRAGVISREEIARKLKRGTMHSVKEFLFRMDLPSKLVNGIPLTWAKLIWPQESQFRFVQTRAGPTSMNNQFCFKLIPWVEAEKLALANETDSIVKSCIFSMARFQRFIHKTNSSSYIRRRLRDVLNEK